MQNQDAQNVHLNKVFENISWEDKQITGKTFEHCRFYKCSLKGSFFDDCNFEKTVFEECDISLIKFKDTSFSEVTITNCKAIGIAWHTANNPLSIKFLQSKISFSSFYGKSYKKGQFINCIAEEVDFTNCNLSLSNFEGTDCRNAVFFNTDLSGANFAGALNYTIDIAINKIKKAKFSLPEALSFLNNLGIIIVD